MNEGDRWKDRLLLVGACVLLLGGLGTRALWGSEGRWAEVTREMFLTRDFFHPSIGGEPYFDKPLLTYWVIALVAGLTGVLNEAAARLPSALAGLAAVWSTMKLGQRLWSHRVGRIAGLLLLTSYGFLFWSRTAAADTENLAAVILAVTWYWYRRDQPGFVGFLVFYLILFLGSLMKGLPALVLPCLAIFPDLIQEKRWRRFLTPGHFLALALASLAYVAPFAYASWTKPPSYQQSGLALVIQENIERFFTPFDHKNPFYLYLYALPALLLPWAPLFLGALYSQIRSWKQLAPPTRWLLMATGLIFLLFTLSGSRRSYYIMPILPFCALIMALFVDEKPASQPGVWHWSVRLQKFLLLLTAGGLVLMPLALPLVQKKTGFEAPPSFALASVLIGATALVIPWLAGRSAKIRSLFAGGLEAPALGFMAMVIMGGTLGWQYNLLDQTRTERPFALQLKRRLASHNPNRVAFFYSTDAKLCFYLSSPEPIRTLPDAEPLQAFLEQPHPAVLITQRRYAEMIPPTLRARLNQSEMIEEQVQPWESESAQKKKWIAWFWSPASPSSPAAPILDAAPPRLKSADEN